MRPYWPALVLTVAFALPLVADEVTATPAAAPVPVATPTYKPWTLRNDVVEVVVSDLQGAIRTFSLINERPIHLRDWQVREWQKQNIALPDPDKSLTVLDAFNPKPKGASHNWIEGVELPSSEKPPWTVNQTDAKHMRLEYADAAKGLRWVLSYELTDGKLDLISKLSVENTGTQEWALKPTLYPLNGVRQDDPKSDATYVSVASHVGGIDGSYNNYGMPGPGLEVQVPSVGLDYICLKSRFFAALWIPLSFTISGQKGAAPVASPSPAQTPGDGGPGGSAGVSVSPQNAPSAPGVIWLTAMGFIQAQGEAHQAYVRALYLGANNGDVRLAPGQVMAISWKIAVTSTRQGDSRA